MKEWCLLIGALLLVGASALDPTLAARDLIVRIIPKYATAFSLTVIPTQEGKDVMQLASLNSTVELRGSSTLALTSALNWYLNDYCNTTYDWTAFQVLMPSILPLPPSGGTGVRVRTSTWSE